ncbi:MAG: nuclease-like protein [Gammaproteobacteria bacterium]|nr:nuclease-like protein [Gammaproteobacteria bacterium]
MKHYKVNFSLVTIILLLSSMHVFAESLSSYAFVNDDGTLSIKNKTIHLYGIHIPATSINCRTSQQPPVCGERAALALEFKIQSFVRCEVMSENPDGSLTGRCFANYSNFDEGEDLSAYLLERGWAIALPDAPFEYHALERIAQSRGMGVWGIAIDRPYINPFR